MFTTMVLACLHLGQPPFLGFLSDYVAETCADKYEHVVIEDLEDGPHFRLYLDATAG